MSTARIRPGADGGVVVEINFTDARRYGQLANYADSVGLHLNQILLNSVVETLRNAKASAEPVDARTATAARAAAELSRAELWDALAANGGFPGQAEVAAERRRAHEREVEARKAAVRARTSSKATELERRRMARAAAHADARQLLRRGDLSYPKIGEAVGRSAAWVSLVARELRESEGLAPRRRGGRRSSSNAEAVAEVERLLLAKQTVTDIVTRLAVSRSTVYGVRDELVHSGRLDWIDGRRRAAAEAASKVAA